MRRHTWHSRWCAVTAAPAPPHTQNVTAGMVQCIVPVVAVATQLAEVRDLPRGGCVAHQRGAWWGAERVRASQHRSPRHAPQTHAQRGSSGSNRSAGLQQAQQGRRTVDSGGGAERWVERCVGLVSRAVGSEWGIPASTATQNTSNGRIHGGSITTGRVSTNGKASRMRSGRPRAVHHALIAHGEIRARPRGGGGPRVWRPLVRT